MPVDNPIHPCSANSPPATPFPSRSKGWQTTTGTRRWYCPACGKSWSEGGRNKGRPAVGDEPMSSTDRTRRSRSLGSKQRQVTYAIFDSSSWRAEDTGWFRKKYLVDVVVARSRKTAIRDREQVNAVPLGQMSAKEKRWVQEFLATKTSKEAVDGKVYSGRTGIRRCVQDD
jgi:hypothetical protein